MRAVRGILPRTPRERKACKWRGVEGVAFDPVFSSRLVDPWWFAARCLLFLLAMFVPCSLGFVLFQRVERGERLSVFALRGRSISRARASGVVLSTKLASRAGASVSDLASCGSLLEKIRRLRGLTWQELPAPVGFTITPGAWPSRYRSRMLLPRSDWHGVGSRPSSRSSPEIYNLFIASYNSCAPLRGKS